MVALAQSKAEDVVDLDRVIKIVTAACILSKHHFKPYPDLEIDDLVQHCMPRALAMIATYSSDRGTQLSTWITMGVKTALLDLLKSRRAEKHRIDTIGENLRPESEQPNAAALAQLRDWFAAGCPRPKESAGGTLLEWVTSVYIAARQVFPPRHGIRGHNWYRPAQTITVAVMMRRLKLSTRGMQQLLEQHEDIRKAMGFTKLRGLPSHPWFVRAPRRAEAMIRGQDVEEDDEVTS